MRLTRLVNGTAARTTAVALVAVVGLLPTGCCFLALQDTFLWTLRDGTKVRLWRHAGPNPHPQESVKVLEVTRPGEAAKSYEFGEGHGGYRRVELRTNADQSVIWVVDVDAVWRQETGRRRVGCCFDRTTGLFHGEAMSPKDYSKLGYPPCVGVSEGEVVAPD